jgi:hypothetical protein
MPKYLLTTTDNPFDPHTQFKEWYQFDTSHGYHSSAYLARIVLSSEELPEAQQDKAIEMAIDEIVELNLLGIYKKVVVDGN